MKISNPSNGFVRIEVGDDVLLADVWLRDGIYEGGWHVYPPVRDRAACIAGATHLYVSHIHEDHFDLATIAELPRDVLCLLPKVYPHHVVRAKLEKLGFHNLRVLEPHTPTQVGRELSLEVIPPMNAFGQQLALYAARDEMNPSIAIDTGYVVRGEGLTAVFLADNFPYDIASAEASLAGIEGCDLLAHPYNGTASDYPFCYNAASPSEILAVLDKSEARRTEALDRFIARVRPKRLMPYSSDFAVAGPCAETFAAVSKRWWANKAEVAARYEKTHGIPAVHLYEADTLLLAPEGHQVARSSPPPPPLAEVAKQLRSALPLTVGRYPAAKREALSALVQVGAKNLFAAMERLHLQSEWVLALDPFDLGEAKALWHLDLAARTLADGPAPRDRKHLTCRIDSGFLAAILGRKSHWNNAQLSFQLVWQRVPNDYDDGLYKALNYFHEPMPAR